jgi:hypothetical protein
MGTEVLERRFAAIGARVNVVGSRSGAPRIDVGLDARGEFFDIRFEGSGRLVELEVVDVDRSDRHLLLLVRDGDEKSKFLCGHDERHWFVAAVPEDARGGMGVATAKAALQQALVGLRLAGHGRRIPSADETPLTSARASGSSSRRSSSIRRPRSSCATSRFREGSARRM